MSRETSSLSRRSLLKVAGVAALTSSLPLAGALSGNVTTVGIGLSSARKTSMYTSFEGTKKLKAVAGKGLIKLDAPLSHDRTYCEQEDFNFVWNYIKSRCEGAQITEKL